MTTTFASNAVDKVIQTVTSAYEITPSTIEEHHKPVGKYVGSLGIVNRCWEANDLVRNHFYTHIKPEISRQLDGLFGSVSTRDCIVVTLYMIGRRSFTATPTVLFVSENDNHRKDARKLIKESGLLSQYRGWKTAHASKDPGWGAELEQLATGQGLQAHADQAQPVTEVLYNTSTPLRSNGMTIWVPHDSSFRSATANLIRLEGQPYFLAPAHTFFNRPTTQEAEQKAETDDFEIDSEDGSITLHDEDSYEDAVEYDDVSSSDESVGHDLFTFDTSGANYSQSSFGSSTVHDRTNDQQSTLAACDDIDNETEVHSNFDFIESQAQSGSRPRKTDTPHPCLLRPFGTLVKWSISKDWALIAADCAHNTDLANLVNASEGDLSCRDLASHKVTGGLIMTYTSSRGSTSGTVLATVSDFRASYGTSFEEVYALRLDGALSNGDCGSAVFDESSGKLYGHIVAGCRSTGFAYVMAAHHVIPDLRRAVSEAKTLMSSIKEPVGKVLSNQDNEQFVPTLPPLPLSCQQYNTARWLFSEDLNPGSEGKQQPQVHDVLQIPNGYVRVDVLIIRWDEESDFNDKIDSEVCIVESTTDARLINADGEPQKRVHQVGLQLPRQRTASESQEPAARVECSDQPTRT